VTQPIYLAHVLRMQRIQKATTRLAHLEQEQATIRHELNDLKALVSGASAGELSRDSVSRGKDAHHSERQASSTVHCARIHCSLTWHAVC
jgi:hypothetical protein